MFKFEKPKKSAAEIAQAKFTAKINRQNKNEESKDLKRKHHGSTDRTESPDKTPFGPLDLIPIDHSEEHELLEGSHRKPLRNLNIDELDNNSGWESFGESIGGEIEAKLSKEFEEFLDESNSEIILEQDLTGNAFTDQSEYHTSKEDWDNIDAGIISSLHETDEENIRNFDKNRYTSKDMKTKTQHDPTYLKTQKAFLKEYKSFIKKKYPGLYERMNEILAGQEKGIKHPELRAIRHRVWSEHEIEKYKSARKQKIEPNKINEFLDEQNKNAS